MHERIRQLKDWAISDIGAIVGDNIGVDHPRKEPTATIIDLKTFSKLRMVYEANRRRAEEDIEMFEILKAAYEQL
jgi:glutamyl-tRNA synthetase